MADFIETSPDVALQHPRGAGLAGEHLEALLQRIGTTPAFAKAIGVSVGQSLRYGGEGKRVKRLHGPVVQGGDAQGAQFAVGLGDVNAAQGPGSVSVVAAGTNMQKIRRLEIAAGRGAQQWKNRRVLAAGFLGAATGLRCRVRNQVWIWSFLRKLVPSMITVSAWWRSLSKTAEAMVLSLLKMLAHCLKGLLVVNTMEPRS